MLFRLKKTFTFLFVLSFFIPFGLIAQVTKPYVLFSGRFADNRLDRSTEREQSQNALFKCNYEIERNSIQKEANDWVLKNFRLYKSGKLLYRKDYIISRGVSISNAGYISYSSASSDNLQGIDVTLLSPSGEVVMKKSVESADLFSFSPNGTFYGINSKVGLEIIDLRTKDVTTLPSCEKFTMCESKNLIATVSDGLVLVYKNGKKIFSIKPDFFIGYVRDVKFSPDGSKLVMIGKKKILAYDVSTKTTIFENSINGDSLFREIRVTNGNVWSAINVKNREDRIYSGVLKTYFFTRDTPLVETGGIKKFEKPAKLRYNYKKGIKGRMDEVPWPFKPFDEPNKEWNGYLQLASSSDNNISGAYLHQGLDMHLPAESEVYAVAHGYVKCVLSIMSPEYLYWRCGIADKDKNTLTDGWLYAHLIESTIAVDVGETVEQGDFIANLVKWQGFADGNSSHIHFSRIKDHGVTWKYSDDQWWNVCNPLSALRPLNDTHKPVIEDAMYDSKFAYTTNDKNGYYDYLSPDSLYGDIDIAVKIYNKDWESEWIQPAFSLYYWILKASSGDTVVHRTLGQIRNFSIDYYTGGDYTDLAPIMYRLDSHFEPKGWFTPHRIYAQIITNNNGDSTVETSEQNLALRTGSFKDGAYRIYVEASDASGNTAIDSEDVWFYNMNVDGIDNKLSTQNNNVNLRITSSAVKFSFNNAEIRLLKIYTPAGKLLSENRSNSKIINIGKLANGIYLFKVISENGSSKGRFLVK